jgi:hypothetical protein
VRVGLTEDHAQQTRGRLVPRAQVAGFLLGGIELNLQQLDFLRPVQLPSPKPLVTDP